MTDPTRSDAVPTPPSPARPRGHALSLAALAAVGAGIAAIAGRYAFLPLGGPGTLPGLLTGGGIGLVVGGVQVLRMAHRAGHRPPMGASSLTIVVAAGLVAGLFVLLTPSGAGSPDEVGLVPTALGGFRVALPAWPVEREEATATLGERRLTAPGTAGRFVQVRWWVSPPLERAQLVRLLESHGGLSVEKTEPVTVDGRPTELLALVSGTKHAAATAWQCPESGVSAYLVTFVDGDRDVVQALHRRILASVVCGALETKGAPPPAFPEFTPPKDYERVDGPNSLAFAGPRGDAFLLFPLLDLPAGAAPEAVFSERLRTELLVAIEFTDVRYEPSPLRVTTDGGAPMVVWRASVRADAGEERALLVAVVGCGTRGALAVHDDVPGVDAEPAVSALRSLGCSDK